MSSKRGQSGSDLESNYGDNDLLSHDDRRVSNFTKEISWSLSGRRGGLTGSDLQSFFNSVFLQKEVPKGFYFHEKNALISPIPHEKETGVLGSNLPDAISPTLSLILIPVVNRSYGRGHIALLVGVRTPTGGYEFKTIDSTGNPLGVNDTSLIVLHQRLTKNGMPQGFSYTGNILLGIQNAFSKGGGMSLDKRCGVHVAFLTYFLAKLSEKITSFQEISMVAHCIFKFINDVPEPVVRDMAGLMQQNAGNNTSIDITGFLTDLTQYTIQHKTWLPRTFNFAHGAVDETYEFWIPFFTLTNQTTVADLGLHFYQIRLQHVSAHGERIGIVDKYRPR